MDQFDKLYESYLEALTPKPGSLLPDGGDTPPEPGIGDEPENQIPPVEPEQDEKINFDENLVFYTNLLKDALQINPELITDKSVFAAQINGQNAKQVFEELVNLIEQSKVS